MNVEVLGAGTEEQIAIWCWTLGPNFEAEIATWACQKAESTDLGFRVEGILRSPLSHSSTQPNSTPEDQIYTFCGPILIASGTRFRKTTCWW